MNRPNNPRFNGPPVDNRGQLYVPRPIRRPSRFHNDEANVQSNDATPSNLPQSLIPPPALKPHVPEVSKWKSTFTAAEENDGDREDSPASKSRFLLYNPYENDNSDADDNSTPKPPPEITKSRSRWDVDANQKLQQSSRPPTFPVQQPDSAERAGPADHSDTDSRSQVSTTVRLSPPPSLPPPPMYKYKPPSSAFEGHCPRDPATDKADGDGWMDTATDPVNQNSDRTPLVTPKNLISCDLCEVKVSNGQELEDHLDSKTHWDTLEYIQQNNNYDDITIAFLQDVMLYKSRKSSRAIEEPALQALQDYDHMTKVEVFHCAACNAFVPTSASAVQHHIVSQEHMTHTAEFEARQRRLCLDRASTMMEQLMPQFMSFAKGPSPCESLEKPT